MDTLLQDLRYAFRSLRRRPGFTLVAVLTLGLGIGATTAIFSVVDAVLLRPLPVRDQDRLVVAWQEDRARGAAQFRIPFGYAEYEGVRERARALSGVAALPRHGTSRWIARDGPEAQIVGGVPVTGQFFSVLGVRPAAGRLLGPEDDLLGAPLAVVLSHRAWRGAFGGEPAVVGRTIELTGRSASIVGVAAEGFDYPRGADVWVAALAWWNSEVPGGIDPTSPYVELDLIGRLAPSVTPEQARTELDGLAADVRAELGARYGPEMAVVVRSLADVVVGDVRPALLLIATAVALVLVIAGVNVANLLLVRGLGRRGEFAVRSAMGAGRRRIVRQLLTESVVLGLVGGAFGVLLAALGIDVLLALAPAQLPRLESVAIDARLVGFAASVALLSAMLFGLLPALGATSTAPARILAGGDRALGPAGATRGIRHALVVGQIALTFVMLAGAGLLLKSLARMHALDPGFRPEQLTLMDIAVPGWEFQTVEEHRLLYRRMLERVRALPGVVAATGVVTQPFSQSGGIDIVFAAEDQDTDAAAANPWLNYEGVEPDYIRAMGLPILRGRGITSRDREDGPLVIIVNEMMARQTWPNQDPIGRRIKWGAADSDQPWRTVVGMVADARYRTFEEVRPSVYVPFEQGIPVHPNYLVVRTRAGTNVVPAVRRILAETSPDLVMRAATPMEEVLDRPLARPRFQTLLLGLLAGLGLILSAIGLYGVVAYAVAARTREMGLRIALGARRGDVLRVVLRGAAALTGTGIVIGLAGALVGTRLLRGLLFQVRPLDPTTFAAVALVLAAVGLLAGFVPAHRAASLDPTNALRAE